MILFETVTPAGGRAVPGQGPLQFPCQLFFADRDLSGHRISRLATVRQQAIVHFPGRLDASSLANYFSPIVI
jgi:hypothetical protein